ncbi:S66 family peptidase [Rubrivivax gelatinosus]|uniref:S66 family peptidase n=1 Tax=Rubrivivax gelatinosus TaxID=28068 RepID=UPI0005C1F85B|nr:S66 peptidase family protein [Rubrivivax gelatinosus]MBG6080467.1 muramoyltetrapeptide carboxypeptidase LdcA involved in peptidoglycan recycling [Rubrivivax gelatinosus]
MSTIYPAPLRPGSRIAVTAPSSGVAPRLHARLELALGVLRARGFVVEEGRCLRQQQDDASAPAAERAAELMALLLREDVDAIVPPWGGELAIEVLQRLDWAALTRARPKWLLGYSDTSTLLLPITLRLGWATAHGPCLMDLVPGQDDPLTAALFEHLATPAGGRFVQAASSRWQRQWTDFASAPEQPYQLSETTIWRPVNAAAAGALDLQGRLIGGCIDTLMHLAASPDGDLPGYVLRSAARGEATLLYLENAELPPPALVRALRGLRAAGWFDGVAAMLIGRSGAEPADDPQRLDDARAVEQSTADLPCPVLADLDIGHRPPQWLLLNGAMARLRRDGRSPGGTLEQRLA